MAACGGAGEWECALLLFEEGQRRAPEGELDASCFAVAIRTLEPKQWARALELLARLGPAASSGPGRPQAPAFHAALQACGEAGEWEAALGVRPNPCNLG